MSYAMKSLLVVASILLAGLSVTADAQPGGRPIRIVIPVAPAGAMDPFARAIAARLGEIRGQQVIVENRTGANGIIAAEYVAKAEPDGLTLILSEASPFVLNPHLYKNLPYDAVRSFTPISQLAKVAWVLGVNSALPVNNFAELVALAKAKPEALSYGSIGLGSSTHVLVDSLKKTLGIEILHVAYKGAGPALTDLLAGQVSMMMITPGLLEPHARTGKLKLIAAATPQRIPRLPELPTIAESGVPGYEGGTWFGLFGPAGLARDTAISLHADTAKVLSEPAFRDQFTRQWIDLIGSTPEQFSAFLKADFDRWAELVKRSGVSVQ